MATQQEYYSRSSYVHVGEMLKSGGRAVGTMIRMIRNPAIASVAAQAGLDFIMLDMEHGGHSMESVCDVAAVARAGGIGCFVRVPELARSYVSRAMDAGCDGVMVPMIAGSDDARALSSWAKYPPVGNRGFGSAGGHTAYGSVKDPASFFAEANRTTISIAQIETVSAIDQIEEIAAIEGIDALLIGPNDLAISYGVPGQLDSPIVEEAIGKVAVAVRKHAKIFGMHGPDQLTQRWIAEGLTLIMSSLDIAMLAGGMKGVVEKYGI